jgi:hypothetical protein
MRPLSNIQMDGGLIAYGKFGWAWIFLFIIYPVSQYYGFVCS